MNLIEFIGFIISFVAFIIIIFKRIFDEQKRRANPEMARRNQVDQEKRLKEFLKSLDVDMEEEEEEEVEEEIYTPPPPPPKTHTQIPLPVFSTPKEAYIQKAYKAPDYHIKKISSSSRGKVLLNQLKSKKEMVILQEIISKPLSLR